MLETQFEPYPATLPGARVGTERGARSGMIACRLTLLGGWNAPRGKAAEPAVSVEALQRHQASVTQAAVNTRRPAVVAADVLLSDVLRQLGTLPRGLRQTAG